MSLDDLLLWMSARGEGSWPQFRSAVEELHVEAEDTGADGESSDEAVASDLPLYQAVRLNLQRLGHVEFFSTNVDKDWRVVPPTLATSEQQGQWRGVLCGARFPDLQRRLAGVGGAVSWSSDEITGMPKRIEMAATDLEELCQAAKRIGLAVQLQAPTSLLAAIPPVDDPRSRFPAEPPAGPGWIVERFSTSKLRWKRAESRDLERTRTGLFQFRLKYQRFHFLRWQGKTFRVQVQVGKYAVLRRHRIRNLLSYDRGQSVLSVPVPCRPPFLLERALVLCSGRLPRLVPAQRLLAYTQVPWSVAQLAGQLLRQEIQLR
ncbi:MAG: hypothetical protein KJZ78_03910 [Bryobacteraceae bacterium]|nr:hypothetical protein [Bryobacteraceae bacterium]